MTACIDQTNAEPIYTRNKIRLELLPYLAEQYNENIIAALNRLGSIAQHDKAYLQETAARAFADARVCTAGQDAEGFSWAQTQKMPLSMGVRTDGALCQGADRTLRAQTAAREILLSCDVLRSLHTAIRTRVYQRALQEIGMTENFSSVQAEAIEQLLQTERPSAEAELPDGFRAARVYDKLKFYRAARGSAHMPAGDNAKAVRDAAAAGQRYRLWQTDTAAYLALLAAGRLGVHGAFCADALPAGAQVEVRTRRDGDYLPIRGGRKKLQDFLVDVKVPKNRRDELLLLACGSRILWILPSPLFHAPQLREKGRFCADAKVDRKCAGPIIILEISNIL